MKRQTITVLFTLMLLMAILVGPASATLTNIGTATYNGGTYNLIYDNAAPFGPIVWLDYSNDAAIWSNQVAWASNLNTTITNINLKSGYSVNWGSGWRLPTAVDGPNTYGFNGTTTSGYNITSSELGHLYYMELGNKGYYDLSGSWPQLGWGLVNKGPFANLLPGFYWSGTEWGANTSFAFDFFFYDGDQTINSKSAASVFALAVRPGQLVSGGGGGGGGGGTQVPVMDGWWLLPGMLAGVGLLARRRKE